MRVFSEDDLAILTLYLEADNQSYDGKTAIGEVIRNRMERQYFSDGTVASTVMWPYQFSCFNTECSRRAEGFKIDYKDPMVDQCKQAWARSEHTNLVGDAMLYCNLALAQPDWATAEKFVAKVGDHSFYLI